MFRIAPTVCLLVLGIFIADTSAQSLNANDGSKAPPRLMLVQAMWGMGQLPSKEAEWSLEEKMRLVKEAGFDGVDFAISMVAGKEQQIKVLLAKYDLKLGLQTFQTPSKT